MSYDVATTKWNESASLQYVTQGQEKGHDSNSTWSDSWKDNKKPQNTKGGDSKGKGKLRGVMKRFVCDKPGRLAKDYW